MKLDWTHVEGIAMVIFMLAFVAWTALTAWIAWGFGHEQGKREGWRRCRRFLEEHPGEELPR